MNLAKLVFISIALLFIQACSHPIDIEGVGDVVTTENGGTGTRGCTYEDDTATPVPDNCAKNYVLGLAKNEVTNTWDPAPYRETYTAVPRDGWQFDSWVNCAFDGLSTESGNICTFNVPATTVRPAWGATMPPLKAIFTPLTGGTPITSADIVTANGKEWAQVDLFTSLSWNDINAVCPAGSCKAGGVLNGHDMTGWTWASSEEMNAFYTSFGVVDPNGFGPLTQDTWPQGVMLDVNIASAITSIGWRLTEPKYNDGSMWVTGWTRTDGAYCAGQTPPCARMVQQYIFEPPAYQSGSSLGVPIYGFAFANMYRSVWYAGSEVGGFFYR